MTLLSQLLSQQQHALASSSPAFGAAATAMGELTVAGCIGALCVQQQIITSAMVRALSQTIFHVLLPLFMATNMMKAVSVVASGGRAAASSSSSSSSSSLLTVPILAVVHATIMFVLCRNILIPLLFGCSGYTDSDDGKTMAVTCGFGNAGVLPFVFVEAMFRDRAFLQQQAYSLVSLFSAGWSPLFWSLVPKVLGIKNNAAPAADSRNTKTSGSATNSGRNESIDRTTRTGDKENTTLRVVLGRFLRQLQVYFPPPVVGVVAGILIGLSKPLSSLLLPSAAVDQNHAAAAAPPLAFIYNSCQNLGKAASPMAVLVLACSLALGVTTTTRTAKHPKNDVHLKAAAATTAACKQPSLLQKWACVSLARFVLSPLVMLALLCILSSSKTTLLHWRIPSHHVEPMLWFICLLEAVMPPAQNSVVLLQVAVRPRDAEQMATFLFYIYATSMIPIVVLITIALQWLQILSQ